MRSRLTVVLVALGLLAGACSSSKTVERPPCPTGPWKLSPTSVRDLVGLDLDSTKGEVRGDLILSLDADGRTRYGFEEFTLIGVRVPGNPESTSVRIGGGIRAQSTIDGDRLNIELIENSIQVTSGGQPAGGGLTAFISSEFEQDLTGPATFTCPGNDLRVVDETRGTTLLWNPVRVA